MNLYFNNLLHLLFKMAMFKPLHAALLAQHSHSSPLKTAYTIFQWKTYCLPPENTARRTGSATQQF